MEGEGGGEGEDEGEGEGEGGGEGEGEGEGAYLGTMAAPLILTSELVTPPSGSSAIAAGEMSYEVYENAAYMDIGLTHNIPDAEALLLRDVANNVTLVTIPVTGSEMAYRLTEGDLEDIADAEENNDGVIAAILTSDRFPSGELQGIPRPTRYVRWLSSLEPEERDGMTWVTAYNRVQQAIDDVATQGGGDVWVSGGFYADEQYASESLGSLVLRDNVRLFGGFLVGDTDFFDRDLRVNGSLLLAPEGSESSIVYIEDKARVRLDGFSIAGMQMPIYAQGDGGGAVRIVDVGRDVVFTNLRIAGNTVMPVELFTGPEEGETEGESEGEPSSLLALGGGLYLSGAEPVISNSSIYGNASFGMGGGIYLIDSDPLLENNLFAGNHAFDLDLEGESVTLAGNRGAGIYADEGATFSLANAVFVQHFGAEVLYADSTGLTPASGDVINTILYCLGTQ